MTQFVTIGGEFDDKWGEKRDKYQAQMQEHAEKLAEYIAQCKEAALWRIFFTRFNLTTLAQIKNFKQSHKCGWIIERDGNRERFRIDGKYYYQIAVEFEGPKVNVISEHFEPPIDVPLNVILDTIGVNHG